MMDIAIFGIGGFGREVLTLIMDINKTTPQWNIIGFFDDGYPIGYPVNGFKTLGGIKELNNWNDSLAIVIAVGNPSVKKKIVERVHNNNIIFPTLIHPTTIIGNKEYVQIGNGCIICAANIITTNVVVKDFVTLNLACTVGHDTEIGDFCSFMPSINISGEVVVHECVYVGTGAKIINQLEIGDGSIIGAGAVVTKSLPSNCTAVGVPAKVIKYH